MEIKYAKEYEKSENDHIILEKEIHIDHKILEKDIYTVYKTKDSKILKVMKSGTPAYHDLMFFHEDKSLVELLFRLYRTIQKEIITFPTEIYTISGYVKALVYEIDSYLRLSELAPKTNIVSLIESLESFYQEVLNNLDIDFTKLKSGDLIYTGSDIQILDSEYLKYKNVSKEENISTLNKIVIQGLFGIDKVSEVDDEISTVYESVIMGENNVTDLLHEIASLESKKNGQVKYLRHMNGYIR